MYLNKQNLASLSEEEIERLCTIASIERVKNILIDYYGDESTRKKHYGKGSKEWNNKDRKNPPSSFVKSFFVYLFTKEENVPERYYQQFEEKLLKTIVGKENYQNPSIEMIHSAIDEDTKYSRRENKAILYKAFGFELEKEEPLPDEDATEGEAKEEEKPKFVLPKISKKDDVETRINQAVSKQAKEDKKNYDDLKKKYDTSENKLKKSQEDLSILKESCSQLKKERDGFEKKNIENEEKLSSILKKLNTLSKRKMADIDKNTLLVEQSNALEILQLAIDELKKSHYDLSMDLLVKAYVILGLLEKGE